MEKPQKKKVTSERQPKYQVGDREFWLYRFDAQKWSALAYETRQGIGKWRKRR